MMSSKLVNAVVATPLGSDHVLKQRFAPESDRSERRALGVDAFDEEENCHETRAAVALEKAKPLQIAEVNLDGPKAGEVLVEVKATGICHTDEFTLSGADPEGLFPAILGHEGAGIVVDVGPGVTSVKKDDHVIPLYTPECRQCPSCLSRKTNLCTAIRATQGQGVMPDGTSRFSLDGKKLHHYMGTSTFANFTVLPEIAVAKIREDAPFDKVCYIGCGVTTGIGAVLNTAKVELGSKCVVFGLRRYWTQCHPGPAACRRRHDHRRRHQQWQEGMGRALRHDPLRQSEGGWQRSGRASRQRQSGRRPDRRRRLHLRLHRQCRSDAPSPGGLPPRLGSGHHYRRGSRPVRKCDASVPAGHRPRLEGTAFGGARGRTDVPKIVDWYMEGKIEIDPMITHAMPLPEINKGFDLMQEGKSIRSVVVY